MSIKFMAEPGYFKFGGNHKGNAGPVTVTTCPGSQKVRYQGKGWPWVLSATHIHDSSYAFSGDSHIWRPSTISESHPSLAALGCLCANSKLYSQHKAVPCFNLNIQYLVSSGNLQEWPAGGAEFQKTLAKLHTCILKK